MKIEVSAYIPCFNNADTIAAAIASVRVQTVPVNELFVVDDGSHDNSEAVCRSLGVRMFKHEYNLGRGATRARGMEESRNDLVLCCDATNQLEPSFIENAMKWFENPSIGAVFGRISQRPPKNAVERWRGRHLFRSDQPAIVQHKAGLITYGALVRRSAVMGVGNYSTELRHSEDADLGERLTSSGYDVIYDPALAVLSIAENSVTQVLERYWRWNAGKSERRTIKNYVNQMKYCATTMAMRDLRAGDIAAVFISLLCPHYQFWHSWMPGSMETAFPQKHPSQQVTLPASHPSPAKMTANS